MPTERIRETLTVEPTSEHWASRLREGWRPVAVEWEREATDGADERVGVPIPFGLEVAEGGRRLVPNQAEWGALERMLELIVEDRSLSEVATELDRAGYRTRSGQPWTQVRVFEMLPRLIEVAPEIQASPGWSSRARALRAV